MARDPIPTWFFAIVVVRDGDRFLLVHERKHGQKWYLPAGRVEPGETLTAAAIRETIEESGITPVLDGVLRVEHTPTPDGTRCRIFFLARPADEHTSPKSVPDDESLGAAWVRLDELDGYPLRGVEVREILTHVAGGGTAAPVDLLTFEGAPWR